jgi:hypothetical protein
MVTLTRSPNGCWCRSVRNADLIGANVPTSTLHGLNLPDLPVVAVTGQDHTTRQDGTPRCWLILDGWVRWPIHAALVQHADSVTIDTTDAAATIQQRIREPITHTGQLTLSDADRIASDIDARYQMAGMGIPVLPGGSAKVRRAFTPQPPKAPPTTRSWYTRGRVRHVYATGMWAADQGWAGTTRSLGEHETPEDAEAAVRAAVEASWARLDEWLRTYVHGEWQLAREPLEVERIDRVTGPQVADMLGISPATWRSYVSRGMAPDAGGHDPGTGRPWWDREAVLSWHESRRGQDWRRTDGSPDA